MSEKKNHQNLGSIIFLINQAATMSEPSGLYLGNKISLSKAAVVADAINQTLNELILLARKRSGINNFIDLAILGYGGYEDQANFIWQGKLLKNKWVSINELNKSPLEVDLRNSQITIKNNKISEDYVCKTWIKARSFGSAAMKDAFVKAKDLIQERVKLFPDSKPPLLINIANKAAEDCFDYQEIIDIANEIKQIETTNKNPLILNCELSWEKGSPIIFPDNDEQLKNDPLCKKYFDLSSQIPEEYFSVIEDIFYDGKIMNFKTNKSLIYSANMELLRKFLYTFTVKSFR